MVYSVFNCQVRRFLAKNLLTELTGTTSKSGDVGNRMSRKLPLLK